VGNDRPVAVTGGKGQLGRAFSRLLPEAVILDRASLDITRHDKVHEVFENIRPGVIINAAAFTKVDAAEAEPELASRVNCDAVGYLAEVANALSALLVQISTDYVFPGDKQGSYTESDPTGPLSVYGKTKLRSEGAASAAGDHLIVRTSWVFGQGTNFISSILGAATKRAELSVVCDQTGLPTYAWDLAKAINVLVDLGARGLFHVAGGGDPASWAEVAATAITAAGLSTKVNPVTTRQYYAGKPGPIAPRPSNSVLDCSKAAAVGVSLRPWKQAVAAYVEKELRK
jgi:dTDP-4-dehydrorhamnose 3,5-epimerase